MIISGVSSISHKEGCQTQRLEGQPIVWKKFSQKLQEIGLTEACLWRPSPPVDPPLIIVKGLKMALSLLRTINN